ncbi:unnamed protein product, partial [Prorocentrum cordatum]
GSRGSYVSASPTTSEWKRDPSGARHYVGHRASPSTAPRARARAGCRSSNHTENACSTSGMRRSRADVAKAAAQSSPPPAPKPPVNNVSQQLQAVAAELSQAAGVSAATSCETPPQTPPPPTASPSPAKRSQMVDAAKKLEAALAAAPEGPGLEEARRHLQVQLDAKRKELGDTRPLGKRLDGAKAALERA